MNATKRVWFRSLYGWIWNLSNSATCEMQENMDDLIRSFRCFVSWMWSKHAHVWDGVFHHAMDKHERAEQIDFCNESRNVGCVDAKVALNFLLTHIPISHVCLHQAFIKYTWGHAAVGATRGRGTHRRCATELAIPWLLLGYNLQLFVKGGFVKSAWGKCYLTDLGTDRKCRRLDNVPWGATAPGTMRGRGGRFGLTTTLEPQYEQIEANKNCIVKVEFLNSNLQLFICWTMWF